MRKKWLSAPAWALMICIVCIPAAGFSKTGYVSDSLILTFRQGPGKEFPVIKSLRSDTPLSILEEQERYYKVQLDSGETGWVDKQYIVFTPTKQMRIDQLQKEKKALEQKLTAADAALEKERASFKAGNENRQTLMDELDRVKQENKELKEKLSATQKDYEELQHRDKDAANLLQKNKTLSQANEQLLEKIKTMKSRQQTLTDFLREPMLIKWFLAGVGVLLLGWILGHSVSSKRERRSSLLD